MRCPKKKEIKGGIIKEKRSWSEQRKITIGAGVLINSSPAGASDFAIFLFYLLGSAPGALSESWSQLPTSFQHDQLLRLLLVVHW